MADNDDNDVCTCTATLANAATLPDITRLLWAWSVNVNAPASCLIDRRGAAECCADVLYER